MKIPPARMDAFASRPDPAARIVLLYGPDQGAVDMLADTLARTVLPQRDDPFRHHVLTPEMLTQDVGILWDTMALPSLGGGRCLVRVQGVTDHALRAVERVLKDPPQTDTLCVMTAGVLEKKSKVRGLMEDSPHAAALACYVEEGADRARRVDALLKENGMNLSRDARAFLLDILPSDRRAMAQEIAKLALYTHGASTVTDTDVAAALGAAADIDIDALVMAVGDAEAGQVIRSLSVLQAEGVSSIAMIRAMLHHVSRLLDARAHVEEGKTPAEAVDALRPAVFWKQKTAMTRQVARWSQARLLRAQTRLMQAELDAKTTGYPDDLTTAHAMLSLSA